MKLSILLVTFLQEKWDAIEITKTEILAKILRTIHTYAVIWKEFIRVELVFFIHHRQGKYHFIAFIIVGNLPMGTGRVFIGEQFTYPGFSFPRHIFTRCYSYQVHSSFFDSMGDQFTMVVDR